MIEILGLNGKTLLLILTGYIILSKSVLFVVHYKLLHTLPKTLIEQEPEKLAYNIRTYQYAILYELIVIFVYLIASLTMLDLIIFN